jgi:hypothetical protein
MTSSSQLGYRSLFWWLIDSHVLEDCAPLTEWSKNTNKKRIQNCYDKKIFRPDPQNQRHLADVIFIPRSPYKLENDNFLSREQCVHGFKATVSPVMFCSDRGLVFGKGLSFDASVLYYRQSYRHQSHRKLAVIVPLTHSDSSNRFNLSGGTLGIVLI